MTMHEIWKDIPGYEGVYQVSNMGILRSCHFGREKILKISHTSHGYSCASLYINGIQKNILMHQIVCAVFLDNRKAFRCINHKNGIKTDNRVDNLEWCTHRENTLHSYSLGLQNAPKAWNSKRSRINEKQAREILALSKTMSNNKISKIFGVSSVTIDRFMRGESKYKELLLT